MTALIHVSLFLIFNCIISNGINQRDKSIIIRWMCCLRVSDPFHKPEPTEIKKNRQSKSKEQAKKKPQRPIKVNVQLPR